MKMTKSLAVFATMTLMASGLALAHGGGGMGSGGMMGGSGMMIVADDGSLLITNMDMSGMMGGGSSSTVARELINVSPTGSERWRVSFTDGWPMMPVTDGNLVVVVLVDDWFMGSGGMGDGGWDGGGMGGGMMGITSKDAGDQVTVVGLDLATGAELWRTQVDGDMGSMAQFSPDGSMIYLSIMEMGTGSQMGTGPMTQDQAAGAGMMGSVTIVALDRNGNRQWTYSTGDSGSGGGMMGAAMGEQQ